MNARPTPRTWLAVLSLLALPLLLAGCGNKGPLILPPKNIPVDPATVPANPSNVAMPPPETTPEATGTADESDTNKSDAASAQPPTDEPDDGRRR
ncbi:lipoprotein [Lysobacter sp. LF1]|uniref:Lipoprotein n=1 Tax=Lysobacter stagni TaxID=3045172 RepID=A0ABT6XEC5_9GAMM|nr:lipoprotein [Lysobacter sp. LF1]MDI9238495.1 lipoprotein [Lysobacter sp. LF1]